MILSSIPYLMFFFFMLFSSFPTKSIYDKLDSNFRIYFFIFVSAIFIGLRGFIYTDWEFYYLAYSAAPTLFDGVDEIRVFFYGSTWEPGFLLYMIILKTISGNYFFFQFISHVIDLLILHYFFKKYIPNYVLLGFIFFYLFDGFELTINFFRNVRAIMLFLISIKYCQERKIVPYMLLNILGALFHITSLIYLPVFFLLNRNISRKIFIVLFIIGNIFFILQIQWIGNILVSIIPNVDGRFLLLLERYAEGDGYGISIGYIERQLSFIVMLLFMPKLLRLNNDNRLFVNMFFLYQLVFYFFSEIHIILSRVVILFVCSYWILYPQIYSLLGKNIKLLFLLLLIVYGFMRITVTHNQPIAIYDNVLIEYKSYEERLRILRRHNLGNFD